MEPNPNYELLTTMDYFDRRGDYVDTYFALHIPCVNRNTSEMIADLTQAHHDSIIDSEFSSDDGGHLTILFESNKNSYKNLAKSIAIDAREIRNSSSDDYENYNELHLKDNVNLPINSNTSSDMKKSKDTKNNLRYIH
jgi:hypothetical protein